MLELFSGNSVVIALVLSIHHGDYLVGVQSSGLCRMTDLMLVMSGFQQIPVPRVLEDTGPRELSCGSSSCLSAGLLAAEVSRADTGRAGALGLLLGSVRMWARIPVLCWDLGL